MTTPFQAPTHSSATLTMPGPVDWLQILDLQRALANCHEELIGDWYRDPWGWPELDYLVLKDPRLVAARINSGGIRLAAKIDVPKENFATRPAIVMDPVDRLVYQALVDRVSVPLIGDLRPWVYGWRLGRKDPEPGWYSDNDDEWDWYRARLNALESRYRFGLSTDVVSFFASIPIDRLCDDIAGASGGQVTDRLIDVLQAWSRVNGRSGLPQRSVASSALANFYLKPFDVAIEAHAGRVTGRSYIAATRWMDDVWVFSGSEGRLRATQVDLEATTREIGLNLGAAKTDVFHGPALAAAVHNIEHSAVDKGLFDEPSDSTPLEELVDSLARDPEHSSRTSIKFATTRIRRHEVWNLADPFVENAKRMPHGADAIARLLRDSERWRDLEDWYVRHANSPWGALDWSIGHLGTMFPSSDAGTGTVAEYFANRIAGHPTIQLLAVAAHRLGQWDPDRARQSIREAARSAEHPLDRRILALTAAGLGEERGFLRRLLGEFEQNEVTLKMLEATRFRGPRVKRDFS